MSQYRPKPPKEPEVRTRMDAICAGLPSTSQKIRALHDAGYTRSAIAGFLRKGYQHVRNVLTAGAVSPPGAHGVSETTPGYELRHPEGEGYGVFEVDAAGRITLTPALLKAVDALPSRRVPWRIENGELILMSIDAAMRSIDRLLGNPRNDPELSSEALIAERRAEFEREEREFRKSRRRNDR
jgi:hypothetical protein